MNSFIPDSDGVIRLTTKKDIEAAHSDSSLLMVGGFQTGRGDSLVILGEFIRKEQTAAAAAAAVVIEPEPEKEREIVPAVSRTRRKRSG